MQEKLKKLLTQIGAILVLTLLLYILNHVSQRRNFIGIEEASNMKKYIVIFTAFITLLCYSQNNTKTTRSTFKNIKITSPPALRTVSIEDIKRLEKNINKLSADNKRLQVEKDALEKKFNERGLTTEQIAEKAQTFFSNSFAWLLTIIAIFITIIGIFIARQKKGQKDKETSIETDNETFSSKSKSASNIDKPAELSVPSKENENEIPRTEPHWFLRTHKEIINNNVEEARKIFKEYALGEKDRNKLDERKALFLYFLYTDGHDYNALVELEDLVNSCSNEEVKYKALNWLSVCLRRNSQIDAEITLWADAVKTFKSSDLITDSIIGLASALNNDNKAEKAKQLLISRLNSVDTNLEKAKLFDTLSSVEKSLNNLKLAVYCKDKSIELDFNNGDALFDSAFMASENKIDEISIVNYSNLLRINPSNKNALNNLGVCASEHNLKIIAVENYKKSSQLNNTLSMANQGFMLLNNGFTEEAKNLAEKALKMKNPDQNIYSLLARICEAPKEQKEKWEEIILKAKDKQKFFRDYTDAYYLKTTNNFQGKWITHDKDYVTIETSGNNLKFEWQDSKDSSNNEFIIEFTGTYINSSLNGTYSKKRKNRASTILGHIGNKNVNCLGHITKDGTIINLIAEDSANPLSLTLTKIE